jgi:RHS repeat-associated protein
MGYWYQDNVQPWSHTAAYTYDNVNRLLTAVGTPFGSGTASYNLNFNNYDAYGNMTRVQNGSTNGYCPQWAYDAKTNHITTTGCTYDAAGNMTADCSSLDNHSYQWDGEGRVASVDNGSTWTFTYNAVGDRVQWASPSETDQHLFDPAGRWVTNVGQFSVVRRGEGTLAVYDGSETHLDHSNNLGSTTMRTDYSGAAARDILFYPWGGVWESWGADGYNFAGLPWRDVFTTTDLTTFRNFSPGLGRWLSPDPVGGDIANPQSLNRYPYVTNNPTTLIDPLGLQNCRPPAAQMGSGVCVGNVLQITSAEMGWGLVGGYSA